MPAPIASPRLPAQPLLRRDAAVLGHGCGDVHIALSARSVVTVVDAPPLLPQWLETLDGLHSLEQAVAAAPLEPAQARQLLTELDRAGMLADANHGLPTRPGSQQQDDDALLLGTRRRGGRRQLRTVAVTGSRRWIAPVCAALKVPSIAAEPGLPDAADLVLVVADAFDSAGDSSAAAAMAHGAPHVSAIISAVDAALLPLTLPGRTACRRCWQLQRDRRTPNWAAWAYRGEQPQPPQLPQHHRALVLGFIVEHTLGALDQLASDHAAAVPERYLDLRRGTATLRFIEPHPACGCTRMVA